MREIARVGAVGCPCEAVVPAWEDDNTASVHFSEAVDGGVELLSVAYLLGFGVGVPECFGVFEGCNYPVYAWGDYVFGFYFFEHVHA